MLTRHHAFDIIAVMKSNFKPSIVFKQLVNRGIDTMPWHARNISYNLIPKMISVDMQTMVVDIMSIASCQVGLTDEDYIDVRIPMTDAIRKAWNSCVWLHGGGYAYVDIPLLYRQHEDVIEEMFASMLAAMFETSKWKNCDICLWNGASRKVVLCKKTDDFTPIYEYLKKSFPNVKKWLDKNETSKTLKSRSTDGIIEILVNNDLGISNDLPWIIPGIR